VLDGVLDQIDDRQNEPVGIDRRRQIGRRHDLDANGTQTCRVQRRVSYGVEDAVQGRTRRGACARPQVEHRDLEHAVDQAA